MRRLPRVLLVLPLLAGGCGDSEPAKAREVVQRFGVASKEKDYQEICDELIDPELAANVEEIGLPCELAFRRGLGGVEEAELEIRTVAVNGDKASVGVRTTAKSQKPSEDVIELVKRDGEWRISSLSDPESRRDVERLPPRSP